MTRQRQEFVVIHRLRQEVVWRTREGGFFWVKLKASRLLKHHRLQIFSTYDGAVKAAQNMGGHVGALLEIKPQEVPQSATLKS